MKKLISLFLTLFVASNVWAYDFVVNDIYYEIINENEVSVTNDGYEYFGNVVIPSSVTYSGKNYSVTSIGDNAFSDCWDLLSVTIPNSVTSIGYEAFYSCRSLSSVTIPNSVTEIGSVAFADCRGLTSITIPNSVTSIGDYAFYDVGYIMYSGTAEGRPWGAHNVYEAKDENFGYKDAEKTIISRYIGHGGDVVIPNSVTSIGDYAFNDCSGLTSVTIPNSVTSIGYGAFNDCSGLTSVTIPNSVTSIGYDAFRGCSGLTSITIPNSVTSIGESAFSGCSGLTSVTIPNGLDVSNAGLEFTKDNMYYKVLNSKEVSVYAYDYLTGDIIIPSTVTIVGNTFAVTSIGNEAFYDYSGLTSVTIPNSVTGIGRSAFSGCSGLTSVTIPNGVTEIGGYAFYDCSGLTSVTIPNSVTMIGSSAFERCSGLTSVTIPNGVTEIGSYAFLGCSGLTSITIPNSVTSIGNGAFNVCSNLKTLIIKNSTCSIVGDLSTCTALTEYSGPADPFNKYNSSEPGSFSTLLEKITLTSGALDRNGLDYINLSYRTLQEIDLSGIENTNIPDMAFNNCYKLEKVTLPAQLESVGYKSFAGCTALKGISLPATVTKIDNSAFEDCRKLEQILFDGSELKASTSNLETIGDWAFYNCHNLKSLEVPEGVTSIGDAAFYGCTYLQDLKLPSTLKSMGDNTFALCENLKSMTILAENPPSLYEKSFYNVDHTIPVSVPESSLKAYAETEYWSEFIHYKSADEQGSGQGGSTAVSEVSNATAVTIVNGQILVNGEAPAFAVTVSGKKIANANLKAGVYFVVVDGKTVVVSVR